MENLVSSYEEFNIKSAKRAIAKSPTADVGSIKRKMEKLKDLYLNDLIEKEVYERDYTALRDKLREQNQPKERPFEPIDTKPIQTALLAYDLLTRQEKRSFGGGLSGRSP